MDIDLCFVYFRSLTLDHLDAAWYSVSRQDFTHIARVIVLDNNTEDAPEAIQAVLDRYPIPVPVTVEHAKHGDTTKTQSWSVNHICRDLATSRWVFFTRADYILHFDCVKLFVATWDSQQLGEHVKLGSPVAPMYRGFVTSFAFHMAYDERGDQRIEGFRDIEQHGWREKGTSVLLEQVNGWRVESSDLDAGVWLTRRKLMADAGWENEALVAWGYQQTVFQRALREAKVEIVQLQKFLFFHQHHAAPRSYDVARAELEAHWGTPEQLKDFRDVGTMTGSVCDELDKK